jgi:tetratricopeptide (TPR) repeat protein
MIPNNSKHNITNGFITTSRELLSYSLNRFFDFSCEKIDSISSLAEAADPSESICTFQELTMENNESSCFPTCGLSLDSLTQFIEENGGREIFQDKTTREVVLNHIIPITSTQKISYCELINKSEQNSSVYVIHSWDGKFLNLIDDLLNHFQAQSSETYFFIDAFSLNHHKPFLSGWIKHDIPEYFKRQKNVFVDLDNWIDPLIVHRSWCLWEIYSAIQAEAKIEYFCNQINSEQFIQKLRKDAALTLEGLLNKIQVLKSSTSDTTGTEALHKLFTSVGEAQMNMILRKSILHYLITWMDRNLLENKDSSLDVTLPYEEIKIYLQSIMAENYKDCLPKQQEIIQKYEEFYGEVHAESLRCKLQFALFNSNRCGYENALTAVQDCYERSKQLYGPDHKETLMIMYNLGAIQVMFPMKAEESTRLFEDCLKKHLAHPEFGEMHAQTLAILDGLGSSYFLQNDFEKASRIFRDALEKSRRLLGDDHLDTLGLMNNLAGSLSRSHLNDEAEVLYEECLTRLKTVSGRTSMDYTNALLNRARNFHEKGGEVAREQAEQCYFEFYDIIKERVRISKPSASSPLLFDALRSVCIGLQSSKTFDEAERILLLCRKYCENGHQFSSDSLDTHNNGSSTSQEDISFLTAKEIGRINQELVLLYQRQGKYDEAEPLALKNYQERKEKLGESHPYTLTSLTTLAFLIFSEGKNDQATEYYELYLSLAPNRSISSPLLPPASPPLAPPTADGIDLEENNKESVEDNNNQEELTRTLLNLGICYERQKNYSKSLELLRECLTRREQFFGISHPKTIAVKPIIARVEKLSKSAPSSSSSSQCILS